MSIHISQAGFVRYANQYPDIRQNNTAGNQNGKTGLSSPKQKEILQRQRMLMKKQQSEIKVDAEGRKIFEGKSTMSSITSSQNYADALKASRTQDKDTALAKKKLRYNFKSISSQIAQSKTSSNAKQVVSKAKREVLRLKRLANNRAYDEEEVMAAITHAQSMERVAKKKEKHLQEEEMVVAANRTCMDGIEDDSIENPAEEEEASTKEELQGTEGDIDTLEEQAMPMEDMENFSEAMEALHKEWFEATDQLLEKTQESMAAVTQEAVEDLMDEFVASMQDLLEEMGLSDLADAMEPFGEEMDPADLKMMKIKHRCKEQKEMTKADSEYLKAVFDKLSKEGLQSDSVPAQAGLGNQTVLQPPIVITDSGGMAESSGGFDVSI